MTELAQERSDLCLLSGDIGNRMFDKYKEVAPTRFLNCGIAEANMMSLAAGMALSGLRPVVYTITPFTTTRCLEQIKIGLAYHNAPVIVVGTGSGLSYAELGATHHSFEDIAVIRSIPNVNIFAPADSMELIAQFKYALTLDNPSYFRIGKKGEPNLGSGGSIFSGGASRVLHHGDHLAILGIGPILSEAIKASEILADQGISARVISMGSVKPIDEAMLKQLRSEINCWFTLEEHSCIGGFGSSVIEWAADNGYSDISIQRLGIPDKFLHQIGDQAFVRSQLGLDASSIASRIKVSFHSRR